MAELVTEKKNIVIYHGNCYDGVTAAWVCWLKFGDNAIYLPFNYSDPAPEVKGKNIYIVDFSFKIETLQELMFYNNVTVLDHHKTAEAELKDLAGPEIIFDMNRSGAGIAWDYFFDDERRDSKSTRPNLVNYIEDRDLWRFNLYQSREVNAYIQSYGIDLEVWKNDVAPAMANNSINSIAREGESLLRLQSKLVKQICANARWRDLPAPSILTAPYVDTSILMSEVCEQLLLDYPESALSYYSFVRKDGKRQFGLRSRALPHPIDPSAVVDFDVSEIAKMFKGGGHRNAAGFELEEK